MRIVILLAAILISGCGNDTEVIVISPPVVIPPEVNLPIANAGSDMMLQQGATAVLDGSKSFDPEGAVLTYEWLLLSKPASSVSELSNSTTPFPSLYLDAIGDYEVQLVVSNGADKSAPATVKISDSDSIPVANAGADIKVNGSNAVTLDGSLSFDSDGDLLIYQWRMLSSPTDSTAVLARSTSPYAVFSPDKPGSYQFELIVSDGTHKSLPDIVIVTDQNIAPIANAGKNQNVVLGQSITLNGSDSIDADGDPLSYLWRIISAPINSNAILTNETSVTPLFTPDISGDYVISLIVNDGLLDSDISMVTLHRENQAPISNAGINLSSRVGEQVHLDGSKSTDADGDTLSPRWSLISKPKNSAAVLIDIHTMHPTFTPDVPGDFIIQLAVYDGMFLSPIDTVTVSSNNLAPTANAGPAQSATLGQVINLDGSYSMDPEAQPLTYYWTAVSLPSNSTAQLSDNSAVSPSFTVDAVGSYVFQLIVSDGVLTSAPATVVITDKDLPPIAFAGLDQSVATSFTAQLDGSMSSDPESLPLSYHWSLLSSPSGSISAITDSDLAIASLVPDLAGDYVVQLTVEDMAGQKHSDVMVIRDTQKNTIPVADAGKDLQVYKGEQIVLDGSGSSDADGDSLKYAWAILSRPVGSVATLADDTTRNASFTPDIDGDFVIQLVVSDGNSTSLPDIIVVHDTTKNLPPSAYISNVPASLTLQSVVLDGSLSTDINGDTLSYQWSLLFKPAGGNASIANDSLVQANFTPDVAGDYFVSLSVNDGALTSPLYIAKVSVSEPAKGAAITLPLGHNLMMLSATGGDSGSGAIISLQESDLSQTTEIMSFHGVPGFAEFHATQSLVSHPKTHILYSLQSETGVYGTGAIFTLDTKTQALNLFTNIPAFEANGNKIRFAESKLLFHPDGNSLYAYSKLGGKNDAGFLLHINTEPASADYKKVTVIGEIGSSTSDFSGAKSSPISNLYWNGTNKLLMVFGFSRFQPNRPAIEFTASNPDDLSQPWVISTYGSNLWSRGRHLAVKNDAIVLLQSIDPPVVETNTRDGGGGYAVRDCANPKGAFFWLDPDVFVFCQGGGDLPAVLLKTNMGAVKPSFERSFSNWTDIQVNGLVASEVGSRMYINVNDELASSFLNFSGVFPPSLTIKPPFVSEITQPNYSDRPVILGGGSRGMYFIGDPSIVNNSDDNINDRYVSILSYDGGDYGQGAVLTYNRDDSTISMASLGFENGGFPFGRVSKTSTGEYIFSVLNEPGGQVTGSILRYDSGSGKVTPIVTPKRLRPGIGLAESSNGTLYGLGINRFDRLYQLYLLDSSTNQFTSIGELDSTTDNIPKYDMAIDSDHLWFFTDSRIYCYDTTKSQRYSLDLSLSGANRPVRSIVFGANGGDGYFATLDNASTGQGTIQRLNNRCDNPTISDSVTGLVDLPSTALISASDGYFYYGTQSGKLMRFDSANNSVSQAANLGASSVLGFLIEDANGDIVGVTSNGNGEDKLFAFTINDSSVVMQAVPADKPLDIHYPGFTEIN